MGDWDRGRWCDICHQKHYQISPPCFKERRRREQEREEGERAAMFEQHLANIAQAILDERSNCEGC